MGRLKKQKKNSLPCDQDNGPSAIAIFAIHTCFLISTCIWKVKNIRNFETPA